MTNQILKKNKRNESVPAKPQCPHILLASTHIYQDHLQTLRKGKKSSLYQLEFKLNLIVNAPERD